MTFDRQLHCDLPNTLLISVAMEADLRNSEYISIYDFPNVKNPFSACMSQNQCERKLSTVPVRGLGVRWVINGMNVYDLL
jgi:hypothetical protein